MPYSGSTTSREADNVQTPNDVNQTGLWDVDAQLDLYAPEPAPVDEPAPAPVDDRCATCHRWTHRPGLLDFGYHGHEYKAPEQAPMFGPSTQATAVLKWSAKIHGTDNERHAWALEVADLLDELGPDAELPSYPSSFQAVRLERAATARRIYGARAPGSRCAVCGRLECLPGHERRLEGTPRPRGEIRLPAGALVQVMGGPDRQAIGALAIVDWIDSPTMRIVRLGRDGRSDADLVRVGLRGLRIFPGKDSAL